MFSFLRTCQTAFQNGHTILHFRQQWMKDFLFIHDSTDKLYVSVNLFISSRLFSLLVYSCSLYSPITLCISIKSVVISPLSFLILVICVFSFYPVSVAKDLSILLTFSKHHLDFINFSFLFFYFLFLFIANLNHR